MKNLKLTGLVCLLFVFTLSSCEEKLQDLSTTKEIITRGNWSIDYYYAGQDRTAQFHDYVFNFQGNGTVQAVNNADTITGSWNTMRDAGYKDVLVITLNPTASQLADLNTNWNVTTVSLNSIAMKDEANTQLRFRKL